MKTIKIFSLIYLLFLTGCNNDTPPKKPYKTVEEVKVEAIDIFHFIEFISKFLPLVALLGIWYQIRERQKDDMLKNQLDRLNKQISDFYGPMYALYETGHRNFYIYLRSFGVPVDYGNPNQNFRIWADNVFEATNIGMENLIINNADLILGKRIPECFIQFCKWSSLIKVYKESYKSENFNSDTWWIILGKNPHPEVNMEMYLKTSFQVLKEKQSELLRGSRKPVDEEALLEEINLSTQNLINNSKSDSTEENKAWKEVLSGGVIQYGSWSIKPDFYKKK